jgi:hypothetical protein
MRYKLLVIMDDGAEHTVTADDRDWSAKELHDFPAQYIDNGQGGAARRGLAPITETRFLAWSAATRAGLVKMPWSQFNTTDCVSVEQVGEDRESSDPGRKVPSGETSSTSRSGRVSR